jgi:hypothetical protein
MAIKRMQLAAPKVLPKPKFDWKPYGQEDWDGQNRWYTKYPSPSKDGSYAVMIFQEGGTSNVFFPIDEKKMTSLKSGKSTVMPMFKDRNMIVKGFRSPTLDAAKKFAEGKIKEDIPYDKYDVS